MSQQITIHARIDPALFLRASQLKYSTRALRKIDWAFQLWSFVTMMLVMFGLAGAAIVTVILTLGRDAVNTVVLFLLALPVAYAIWCLYHRAVWRTMYKQILASRLYDRHMTYRFDETGFEMTADEASWKITWGLTDDVIADDAGLYVYVGGLIYAIPSAQQDAATFARLTKDATALMRAAKGQDA